MRWIPVLFLLGCAAAADWPVARVTYQGRSFGGDALPTLGQGHLLYLSGAGTLSAWGPDGKLVFETPVTDPNGKPASATSAAMDSDGTVAVAIAFTSSSGYEGGIAYLDGTGRQVGVFSTGRYMPMHLCFDGERRLWAFGWQRDVEINDREDDEDYMLVRRFSNDRKENGGFLPRALFPGKLDPFAGQRGLWRVAAAKDRIGGLAYRNTAGHQREWIELDLEGNLIGRWTLDLDMHGGYAYTRSARLFAGGQGGGALLEFHRDRRAWIPVDGPEHDQDTWNRSLLLGATGDELVFAQESGARLVYVDARALRP
jgi:hypothetical protein